MSASRGNEGLGRLVDQDVVGTLAAGIGWVRRSATTITRLAPRRRRHVVRLDERRHRAAARTLPRARDTSVATVAMSRALLLASATTAAPALAARARPRLLRGTIASRLRRLRLAPSSPRTRAPRPILRAVDPSEENAQTTASPNVSRRAALINLALFGVSVPLWRDVLHDLGYLHGAEDEPADLPVSPPGSGYAVATFAGGVSGAWSVPSTSSTASSPPPPDTAAAASQTRRIRQVGAGGTGHRESVQILYDPSRVSYETLLNVYWHQIDPTREDGMFLDGGTQYTSAIFVDGPEQRRAAEASVAALDAKEIFPGPVKTKVIDLDVFWPAEKYHQDYYRRNGGRYGFYRSLSGRDEFVQGVWGVDEWLKYTAGGH